MLGTRAPPLRGGDEDPGRPLPPSLRSGTLPHLWRRGSGTLAVMRILFVSAEFAPYVRTGGLGNAVAGLAHAVAADHEVTVAVPGYRDADVPGRKVAGRPWRRHRDGNVDVLFWLDESFDRPGVYGPDPSSSYDDNWERFARFSVAVSELAGRIRSDPPA